ncbi:MAG: hypothetical protein EYC70_00455 [Planctomycetota bacterium]|nr:MAG: hypothetical protein EYC70_00455 [Planctomycetota bacterium]
MSLIRRQVREAIVAALVDETVAEERVYDSRKSPLNESQLDAINVFSEREAVETFEEAPRRFRRTLRFRIEGLCYAATEQLAAAKADDLGHEIEQLLFLDITLGGLLERLDLKEVNLGADTRGEKPAAAFSQGWDAVYFSDAPPDQSAVLEALEEINVRWNLPPLGDPDSATDKVEPPQV